MTPTTSPLILIGKPTAVKSPADAACLERGKLSPLMVLGSQTGAFFDHTSPGSPLPLAKLIFWHSAMNDCRAVDLAGATSISRHAIESLSFATSQRMATDASIFSMKTLRML